MTRNEMRDLPWVYFGFGFVVGMIVGSAICWTF
jgi:hypothetical protein